MGLVANDFTPLISFNTIKQFPTTPESVSLTNIFSSVFNTSVSRRLWIHLQRALAATMRGYASASFNPASTAPRLYSTRSATPKLAMLRIANL